MAAGKHQGRLKAKRRGAHVDPRRPTLSGTPSWYLLKKQAPVLVHA